jgi:integrase
MTPHETGAIATPGDSRATAPPPHTFGPQGPTLGDLSDAYLQDYQVRQFRSINTARGRVAHLAAFFGRAVRAAALTTHQIRQYQLVRRAAGAATGTINRETSALHRMGTLAVHWGWLDTVPGFPDRLRENPPRQGFFEHPEYLAVRAHLPAPWQDILDLAYYSGWRKQEILGLTWEEIDEAGGVIRLSPAPPARSDVGDMKVGPGPSEWGQTET